MKVFGKHEDTVKNIKSESVLASALFSRMTDASRLASGSRGRDLKMFICKRALLTRCHKHTQTSREHKRIIADDSRKAFLCLPCKVKAASVVKASLSPFIRIGKSIILTGRICPALKYSSELSTALPSPGGWDYDL